MSFEVEESGRWQGCPQLGVSGSDFRCKR